MSQSRKQRIQDRVEKQRRKTRLLTIIIVVAVIAIIVSAVYFGTRPGLSSRFPFPCLGLEGTTIHVHPWLRIVINNETVTIPARVGIVSSPTVCYEPLHTHDTSGVIHVESDDIKQIYTLGDFFTIWNVTYGTASVHGLQQPILFSQTNILGFQNTQTQQVRLLVDGHPLDPLTTQFASLNLVQYDYCDANNANVPPCSPTAGGNPAYPGGYTFETGHTLLIQY